jgi:subtilisin
MTASSDDARPAERSDRRKPARPRNGYYMIAPAAPGVTRQTLIDRLNRIGEVEIVRTCAERGAILPPIAVVRMSEENAAALRRSAGGALVIEQDRCLRAATFMGSSTPFQAIAAVNALGPGFAVTIQILTASGQAVEHAEVRIVGDQGAAQGLTDKDGEVDLTLYGELPETVTELFVRPRSGYWGLWRHRPDLRADSVNSFALEPLSLPQTLDWGGKAMRFDQLPAECRGSGIKIALIDSGVATSHKQLAKIDHGTDIRGGNSNEQTWSQDVMGHGTPCAGITSAIADADHGIRGYAPESELHVCRLPLDALAATSWRRSTIACRPVSMLRAWGSVASAARPSSSSVSLRQNSKASASSPRPAILPERCCSPLALCTSWRLERSDKSEIIRKTARKRFRRRRRYRLRAGCLCRRSLVAAPNST